MSVEPGIKRKVNPMFILSNLSFLWMCQFFSYVWTKEKLNKITDLLKYQGISKTKYILAWFLTLLIVNIIPMILFIIGFAAFWINLTWILFGLLTAMVVLNYLNMFVLCFAWSSCANNGTTFISNSIFLSYWFVFIIYTLLSQFSEVFGTWLTIWTFTPSINFQIALELIILLSNYNTGVTVSLLFALHKDTNFIIIWCQNILTLALLVLLVVAIESGRCSCKKRKSSKKSKTGKNETAIIGDNSNSAITRQSKLERCFELVSDWNLIKQWDKSECLRLRNVVKSFGDYIAVKNINLDWFKGQIFVWLGHNGAGKTTLLNLILGNIAVDQGVILFENHSWIEDKNFWYSHIGVCGQEDIYYPDLTIYEQIELLSKLKGNNKENKTEILDLITSLGWSEYTDSKGSSLSSGNWRKLCTAFAWWGNSKLVILDEPTSGMDFKSKKLFWDFLQTAKQNRIVILTTHSMDEAEYCADSIGIMCEGELICRGSSSFLKRSYPCGYNINFVFSPDITTSKAKSDLINMLRLIEPGMTIKILSKDWLKLNFPESSFRENKINKIFQTIEQGKNKYKIKDYTVSTTSLEEVFFKVNDNDFARNWFETELDDIMKTISQQDKTERWLFLDEKNETQLNKNHQYNEVNNPKQQENSFSDFDLDFSLPDRYSLDDNDNNNNNFNINTNMRHSNSRLTHHRQKSATQCRVDNNKNSTAIELKHLKFVFTNSQICKHWKRIFLAIYRQIFVFLAAFLIFCTWIIYFFYYYNAIALMYHHDIIFITKFFEDRIHTVYNIVNRDPTNSTMKTIEEFVAIYESMFSLDQLDLQVDSYINYTDISSTDFEYDNTGVNYTNFYTLSSPDITRVMLNNIIQKQLFEVHGVTTYLFDSYASSSETLHHPDTVTKKGNYILLLFFTLIQYCIAINMFKRLFNDTKSGAFVLIALNNGNMYKYWFAVFLFDFILFVLLIIITYLLFSNLLVKSLYLLPLSLFFGIFNILINYLGFFSNGLVVSYYFLNIVGLILWFIFRWIDNNSNDYLWYCIPMASLVQDFNGIQMLLESSKEVPSDFTIKYIQKIMFSFSRFLIQFVICVLLFCGFKTQMISKIKIMCCCKSRSVKYRSKENKETQLYSVDNKEERGWNSYGCDNRNNNNNKDWVNTSMWTPLIQSDCSIKIEKSVTEQPEIEISKATKNLILHVNNISVKYKKHFRKDISGVTNINFGLEPNENWALMGLNNAGKSTIIKTIINILSYEKGFIQFYDYILPEDFDKIRKNIGYCPEQDSLFPYLTVFETFDYYYKSEVIDVSCNVNNKSKDLSNCIDKDVFNENRENNIKRWIKAYGWSSYTNVLTTDLSGGNKRKLLFAIALMNNPQLALLDEPSTGVDPDSRRLMWKNLSTIKRKNRALGYNFNWILSTQSIEEAEILCDNVGLLKKGTFTFLGNSENWKLELSGGYYMKICFKKPWTNDINDYSSLSDNPIFTNLKDIQGISALDIDSVIREQNMEMLYYLFHWDGICGLWVENGTKMEFLDYIENSFRLIWKIQSNKGYIFSNLLNLKNIHQNISEMTLSMQPFETFIDDI